MKHETFRLTRPDGTTVFAQAWRPEGEPRAVVQVAHGMAEHSDRYARFASALVPRGYAVYANDHRAHGRSAGDADLGWAGTDGWRAIVADVIALGEHAAEAHPGMARGLFGHSMGSFAALHVMIEHGARYRAYVLAGSDDPGGFLVGVGNKVARIERLRQGPRGRSGLLAKLSFGAFNDAFKPARTAYDWLSRDPAEVDAYIADPRCGFRMTNQFWVDLTAGLSSLGAADWSAIPKDARIFVLSGDRDPVGRMGKGVRALTAHLRRAGANRLEEKLYPEARHELLNETIRDEVVADVTAFLDRVL